VSRFLSAAFILLAMLPLTCWSCDGIAIKDARVYETPPGAEVLAGYATLQNPGGAPVMLTASDSPEFSVVEFHSMTMVDNVMHMQQEKQLLIPAHGELVFAPGALHLMLIQPVKRFRIGDNITINLHCGSGVSKAVFPVKAR
jgi:copper(I)-binding protein